MKMRWIVIIFLAVIILTSSIIGYLKITGKIVTTKATQQVTMNISITAPPSLTLISPKNQTYLNNQSILLNYSASDEDWVKYSLNSGNNITITSPIYFNASDGAHTLYLYANNSDGLTIRSVNFSVSSNMFNIIHERYKDSKKGNSTNFTIFSYQEIQNLSDIVLEDTDFGKIKFNEIINLTDDADFSDSQIDLDDYTNLSNNRIEINSTAHPNFNKSATLYLYGLTTITPRILKEGSVCPSSICTKENYTGGILRFNVTHFTVYSSEETPTEAVTGGTTGGGGGGAITTIKKEAFSLDKNEIKVNLKTGRFITETLKITNNENRALTIKIIPSRLEGILLFEEHEFTLAQKESKIISLEFVAEEETFPNLYIGEIIVKSGELEKSILVAVEIESAKSLFDIKAEIPSRFSYVMPEESLFAKIEIYNLGEAEEEVDVAAEYKIMDWLGNELISEKENFAVRTKLSYIKEFEIPREAQFGKYVLYVKTSYNGQTASTSVWFNIGKRPSIPFEWAAIALSIFVIIAIIIIYIKSRKIKKQERGIKKVDENALRRALTKRGR